MMFLHDLRCRRRDLLLRLLLGLLRCVWRCRHPNQVSLMLNRRRLIRDGVG